MITESSEAIVRVLERKSNRTIAEVSTWQRLNFTYRFRKVGHGQLVVLADDLTAEAIALLPAGNMALQVIREWARQESGGDEVRVREEYTGPVGAYEFETLAGEPQFTLSFTDNLVYPTERVIDTAGAENVDPGEVSAAEYIRSLWQSQLLAPSDGSRAIDVPATLAGMSIGGGAVDLPVRWKYLADAIEQACIAGDVGIRAPLNNSQQIAFEVIPVNDRTAGGVNAVILSAENTGAVIRYRQDDRAVRNRVYVLGANEGAARDVEVVTASSFVSGDRLREVVVDARHLSAVAEYQARGETELAEKGESQRTIEVTEADREFDIRPGDRVTLEEYLRSDSTSPEVGPVDVLCLARTVTMSPDAVDRVTLEVGSEVPTTALILKSVDRRTEAARFA